jgi:hypothetical protein
MQAQSAINRYARSKAFSTVAAKMVVTAVAAASGLVLLFLWWRAGNEVTLCAAAASFVVALWGAGRALRSSREILHLATRRSNSGKEQAEPAENKDEAWANQE